MAELVDALDLGSSFSRSEGSSPFVRIRFSKMLLAQVNIPDP
jgi:hypothetical protein